MRSPAGGTDILFLINARYCDAMGPCFETGGLCAPWDRGRAEVGDGADENCCIYLSNHLYFFSGTLADAFHHFLRESTMFEHRVFPQLRIPIRRSSNPPGCLRGSSNPRILQNLRTRAVNA